MDWLFGCFGGISKKARKHGAPQKVFQKPFQPLPAKVPTPFSIAFTGFRTREEATNGEDLLGERQPTSQAPAKDDNGGERTPEKAKQGDPWAQLDDLEEELEDLRKQIEKETIDAEKIKEEVTFLKSCGTLLQTPAELKKKDRHLELQQTGTPSKVWHSWLLPLSSPASKLLSTVPSKPHHTHEVKDAALSPVDATGAILRGLQPPIIENQKDGENNRMSPHMSTHVLIQNNNQKEKHKVTASFSRPQTLDTSGPQCEDRVGLATSNKRPGSLFKDELAKQSSMIPLDDYSETTGGLMMATARDDSQMLRRRTEDALSMCEDYPSNQRKSKRLLTATMTVEETQATIAELVHAEHSENIDVVHVSRSDETDLGSTTCTNLYAQGTSNQFKHQSHLCGSSDCDSQMVSHGPSNILGTSESEISQSSSCCEHFPVSDSEQYNRQDEDSRGRPFFVGDNDSHSVTLMCPSSLSVESEETLNDLSSGEESIFLSETTQTRLESVTSCIDEDSTSSFYEDEAISTSLYSHGSTQNSVVRFCSRTSQAARHDSDCYGSEDDLSFADSSFHVSAECSRSHARCGYEQGMFINRENQDFIKTPYKIQQCIDTPELLKPCGVRSRPTSPVLAPVENALQWRQLKRKEGDLEKGLESIEVYDAKKKIHNVSNPAKSYTYNLHLEEHKAEKGRHEGWDENGEQEVWENRESLHKQSGQVENHKLLAEPELTPINVSLSNWLTPPQPMKGGNPEGSTILAECCALPMNSYSDASTTQEHLDNLSCESMNSYSDAAEVLPVRVDMSLSNWLHVPSKADKARASVGSPAKLSMRRSPSRCVDEQPILGLVAGDINCTSVTKRVHWDGQGIPNTTTKYKEDQRVNWHASPFEVRLERALNKRGKPFEVAPTTPVPNRLKSLQ